MPFRIRISAALLGPAFLSAMLCFGGTAPAEPSSQPMNHAQMQSLTSSPAMQEAIAAAHKGDSRAAAIYFREAAQQGNPLAQATLGRMYFEGKGVPRNDLEALKWLKAALVQNKEPTYSMALATVKDISASLRNSPNEQDHMAGVAAALVPLAAMLPANMRGDRHAVVRGGGEDNDELGDYFKRKLFNEMTDHEFENPITNPAD